MPSANDRAAFDFLTSKGLTDFQAAGVIGNLLQESGNNPVQGQIGGGPGRGIAQWESPGRWDTLVAQAAGRDPFALQTQLDFLWKELSTIPYLGLADLKRTTNVDAATLVFCNKFERPRVANMPRRQKLAREVLAAFGSLPPPEEESTVFWKVAIPIAVFAGGFWYAQRQGWLKPIPGLRWRA